MLVDRHVGLSLLLAIWPGALFAQNPTIRDSAGVRIIESAAVSGVPIRFTLAAKPDIVVGGARDDPADELDSSVGYPFAMRLTGNRILAADRDHWGIFDATGRLISRLGRGGAGPGEFRRAQSGCRLRGDSLLLWDVGNHRISIWGPNGKLAREFTPPGFPQGTACLSDGSILVEGTRMASSREDVPFTTYSIISTAGVVRGTTVPLPATFYSGSVWREVTVRGHGDRFLFADELEFGIRVLDRSGRLVEIMRTKDVPAPVTEASLQTLSMACLGGPGRKGCTPMPTKATTWPAYYGFAVGDDGKRWFQLGIGARDSLWVGFDSTGKTLGKLVVPRRSTKSQRHIVQFGRDDVLVTDFDEDGARRISVYRIVPAVNR